VACRNRAAERAATVPVSLILVVAVIPSAPNVLKRAAIVPYACPTTGRKPSFTIVDPLCNACAGA
jgi:hypothetical protein